MIVKAYAANEAGGQLRSFEYDAGELGDEEVVLKSLSLGRAVFFPLL